MQANELMVGDWVRFRHSDLAHRVVTITLHSVKIDNKNWHKVKRSLQPIPLTEEILEKNGFEELMSESEEVAAMFGRKPKPIGVWQYGFGQFDSVSYVPERSLLSVKFMEGCTADIANIKYVHELQHALRLCGIEKEIVL